MMIGAAVVALWLGVPAERRALEDVAAPLCAVEPDHGLPEKPRTLPPRTPPQSGRITCSRLARSSDRAMRQRSQ